MTDTSTSDAAAAPQKHDTETAPLARPIAGKLGLIVDLLRRPASANLSDMMEATGWQQHSVRGARRL